MKRIATYIATCIAIMLWTLPVQGEVLNYPLDTIDGQVYYRYTVERSVGLYRISVKFGVTQEQILKANPHLQKQGLRFEEVILIPTKHHTTPQLHHTTPLPHNTTPQLHNTTPLLHDTTPLLHDTTQLHNTTQLLHDTTQQLHNTTQLLHDATPLLHNTTPQLHDTTQLLHNTTPLLHDTTQLPHNTTPLLPDTTRLAILLPLHADAIKRDKNMERFYDFYAGALIAIYEAQARGQRLEIHTYDIGKTANRTIEILQQHPEIHQMDAIIGPAYTQQVNIVLDSIREDSTWCLIPFLSRVENKYPYMMKFNPSEQIEADTIARYLAQRQDSVNCIIIEAKEGEVIPSSIRALHEALQTYQVPTSSIALRALLNDSIDSAFRPDIENIVIFNTERYTNLQTVMPHLLAACGNYRITLYSHYSWQTEKIILPQLYASVFAQEHTTSETYDALWNTYFDHELSSHHPRYDLLGYDLTSQLLHALRLTKDGIAHDEVWEGLQARIHYLQTAPDSGYENHIVNIIHQ